jgi:uncharacterized damage-inducible protein DinB
MNPYASYLGDKDPVKVIEATPRRLAELAAALAPEARERKPAPGKWSAREILCHLADCEVVFAFRLRQAMAEDHHVIQTFDQDRWARTYAAFDARAALDVFASVRNWNLALIKAVDAEARSKRLTHPERGEMTFQVLVETMAGHDLNHLQRLEALPSGVGP